MRGMLMFAHNNDLFDYGKMAYAAALSAVHYIQEPISLVTDEETWNSLIESHSHAEQLFDKPIFIDLVERNHRHFDLADGTRKRAKYHNISRLRAYELSPYDETLLLDTDVLVQDSMLQNVWGSAVPIRMNRKVSYLYKNEHYEPVAEIGQNGLPSLWATICYFRRCSVAEEFFALAKYVADNYDYYGFLHQFPTGILRMDFVVTIAEHIMSGYVHDSEVVVAPLPVESTVFAQNHDIMIGVAEGRATFATDADGRVIPVTTYQTVHCMNKASMLDMADRIIEQYA